MYEIWEVDKKEMTREMIKEAKEFVNGFDQTLTLLDNSILLYLVDYEDDRTIISGIVQFVVTGTSACIATVACTDPSRSAYRDMWNFLAQKKVAFVELDVVFVVSSQAQKGPELSVRWALEQGMVIQSVRDIDSELVVVSLSAVPINVEQESLSPLFISKRRRCELYIPCPATVPQIERSNESVLYACGFTSVQVRHTFLDGEYIGIKLCIIASFVTEMQGALPLKRVSQYGVPEPPVYTRSLVSTG